MDSHLYKATKLGSCRGSLDEFEGTKKENFVYLCCRAYLGKKL
jgi:hypothetical protein